MNNRWHLYVMRRLPKIVAVTLGVLAAFVALAAGTVYALSERRLARAYAVPNARPAAARADSAAVARGAHLATAVANCVLCHGEDLGGKVYLDAGALGLVAGPNLTRGRGGVGATFSDDDWVRAIRYGVRRDGTSLVVMPSETFSHLTEDDLAALVAYLKTLPPVDREPPRTRLGPLGRALLVAGKLPILVAPKTPQLPPAASLAPSRTRDYGRYLAVVSGCHGCHAWGLSGGRVAGPRDVPPAPNLTPDRTSAIAGWTEGDFVRAMRTGLRPNGSELHEHMPWRVYRHMTDDELHALWSYLASVPPKSFGNK